MYRATHGEVCTRATHGGEEGRQYGDEEGRQYGDEEGRQEEGRVLYPARVGRSTARPCGGGTVPAPWVHLLLTPDAPDVSAATTVVKRRCPGL